MTPDEKMSLFKDVLRQIELADANQHLIREIRVEKAKRKGYRTSFKQKLDGMKNWDDDGKPVKAIQRKRLVRMRSKPVKRETK